MFCPEKTGGKTVGIFKDGIPSMCGIFRYIWLIFMVNVGKYTIHGWYGRWHSYLYSEVLLQQVGDVLFKQSVICLGIVVSISSFGPYTPYAYIMLHL